MKPLLTTVRILAVIFYGYIYFGLQFDFLSCALGLTIAFAITTVPKQKKPEATTSSF